MIQEMSLNEQQQKQQLQYFKCISIEETNAILYFHQPTNPISVSFCMGWGKSGINRSWGRKIYCLHHASMQPTLSDRLVGRSVGREPRGRKASANELIYSGWFGCAVNS